MKIYNHHSFLCGLLFLCALPLFALGIIEVDWWQWIVTIAISGKFLYTGLSESENRRQERIANNYQRVSKQLLGRYAALKLNLPIVILGVFFAVALFVRFVFDCIIPVWIVIVVLLAATVALFYTIGVNRQITEYIENETEESPET